MLNRKTNLFENIIRKMGMMTAVIFSLALPAYGSEVEPASSESDAVPQETLINTAADKYAALLDQYVNDEGMVAYESLKSNRQALDQYNSSLAGLDPQTYEGWSNDRKIAFWINVYNALTLKTIINHYPIESGGFISGLRFPDNSIRQIPGVWEEITHPVMGKSMTLDQIEHEVLRKDFEEPRIHMALVCAAMGCPPLRGEPYTGERLDPQLEDQTRQFLNNPAKFRIDREGDAVYLSSIFDWFGSDFETKYQTQDFQHAPSDVRPVLEFVARHLNERDEDYLRNENYRIEFLDYDWSLNEQS